MTQIRDDDRPGDDPGGACAHPAGRRALFDARGIFCTYVCDRCEAAKRRHFRADIFTDPTYPASEEIDGEFFQ